MALRELENRGYVVRRTPGYSAIDVARNELAFKALQDGFAETMWIDADIGFEPDSVDRLRSQDLPIVCGIYPKKRPKRPGMHDFPGDKVDHLREERRTD